MVSERDGRKNLFRIDYKSKTKWCKIVFPKK